MAASKSGPIVLDVPADAGFRACIAVLVAFSPTISENPRPARAPSLRLTLGAAESLLRALEQDLRSSLVTLKVNRFDAEDGMGEDRGAMMGI
jgi:hypothetical protein